MKGRIPVALAAAALLAGAATAWADLTQEGGPYPTGGGPYAAYTGDFNGDGRPDVVTANGDSASASVFLRQAGGGFVQEPGSPFPAATSSGTVADVNGDTRPDIVTTGFDSSGVSVLLRNPGGGFTDERTTYQVSLAGAGAGDFNGDGKTDLAVSQANGGVQILLRNLANDGFTFGQSIAGVSTPRGIAVADFNRDGALDLAVANETNGTVTVLLGNGAGTFAMEGTVYPVGGRSASIVAADFDGNGSPDFAVTSYATNTVSILVRNAANTGFVPDAGSPVTVTSGPVQIASGDFDANGTPDLAVATNGGALEVLHRGAGGWTRDAPTPVPGTPNGVAVADFNGDGRADAAVSSILVNQLYVLLSPAPAQPPPPPAPTPTPEPPLPRPDRGEVNVIPVSGKVLIKRKGAKAFSTLAKGEQIPVGATVDTRHGRVTIEGPGASDHADFYAGLFKISQSQGLTTLTLSEKLACKGRKSAHAAAAKKPTSRKLWGEGKGHFRTNGQYGAATVRGTKWLLTDTCSSTRVRVALGSVSFRDKVKRKTVIVRKAKLYTARKKR